MKLTLRIPTLREALGFGPALVFWLYNAVFVALVYFGLIPFELSGLIDDAQRGQVPARTVGLLAVTAGVPVAAIALALLRLRGRPRALGAFFFAVEAPLLLGLGFTLIWSLGFTLPVHLLVTAFLIGSAGHVLGVLRPSPGAPRTALLQLALHTVGACAGLYLAGLLMFFFAPWTAGLLEVLGGSGLLRGALRASPLEVLGALFGLLSGVLVLGVPAGVIFGPLAGLRRSLCTLTRMGLRTQAAGAALAVAAGCSLAFALSLPQPQAAAFSATDEAPVSDEGRREWLEDADAIAAGLENAFLQRHRYLELDSRANLVDSAYRGLIDDLDTRAQLQAAFNAYARPFVFDDTTRSMPPSSAKDRYARFFDVSIDEEVQEELRTATRTRAPWRRGGAADRLDVHATDVHLDAQHITVTPGPTWVDVEIHEVYRNEVSTDEEVRITFELPPTAALTGLWLGPSPDKAVAFPFLLAPRGAARRTYEAQVRRAIDPALLEQVGPRQYRLRVFPIPGRPEAGPAPDVHLWLTYQALAGNEGWPAPKLVELRNLYFDDDTVRTIDGRAADHEGWMPDHLEGDLTASRTPWVSAFEDGTWLRADPAPSAPLSASPARIGVAIDRSYSMRAYPEAMQSSLRLLEAAFPRAVALLTSAPVRGEAPTRVPLAEVTPLARRPFGGQATTHLFEQALGGLSDVDAVVVLTDGGGAPAHIHTLEGRLPTETPVFVWRVGGETRQRPDEVMRAVLASGGGDFDAGPEALGALHAALEGRPGHVGQAAGWRFTRGDGPAPALPPGPRGVAAAWRIRAEARGLDPDVLEDLDAVHRIAESTPVVTPWSSMIVLVNEAQRRMLADETQGANRFSRRDDSSGILPPPASGVSGAPEPTAWVLIGLTGAASLASRRRRKGVSKRDRV